MIADIALGLVSLSLVIAFVFYVRESNKEKAKLINALIAKTPEQARDLDLADKVAPIQPAVTPQQPDLVPLENVDEEEFEQHIKEQLNG